MDKQHVPNTDKSKTGRETPHSKLAQKPDQQARQAETDKSGKKPTEKR